MEIIKENISPTKPLLKESGKGSLMEIEKLNYDIHRFSSYSTNYYPENILIDSPTDQSSRWSAHTNIPPQYITLKLKRPALVTTIKFGKYEKAHVCNVKKFRIFGGLDETHMVLLLESGLKNDNIAEEFELRCITEIGHEILPILYIKVVPLLSWGPTFNFSIWYIELHGQDDPMFTTVSMKNYNAIREVEIIKLCLKHFRQQGYAEAFRVLQEQTHVRLEHPIISDLHENLVQNGNFVESEKFIERYINIGLMDEYLLRQNYAHTWVLQKYDDNQQPGRRGGHQLVIDSKKHLIYLYGGWDGYRDLSDLWVYDISEDKWTMLFENTELHNGPTPRSCHKMIYDAISENLFMLGRYIDNSVRTTDYIKSEFFMYDTRAKTWLLISDDTSQVGGPQLLYDHQMCIDTDKRTIYVFGGKILTPRSVNSATSDAEFSGLFSYHIATNTWTQIFVDCHHPTASMADVQSIKSRVTHCMVFHNRDRKLYIYGGQRGREDMKEFLTYDVDTQTISILNYANDSKEQPSPGYTLRATIDCIRDEIYIFSSLNKVKDRRELSSVDTSNSLWVYSLKLNEWARIYNHKYNPDNVKENDMLTEPCPRYAHQFVYDDINMKHYLFGGNPGRVALPQLRLDEFWRLELEKPKRSDLLMKCRYKLRKLCYQEMTRTDALKAMEYLRTHVSKVVDHNDSVQLNNFHKLASYLFTPHNAEFEMQSNTTTPLLHNGSKSIDYHNGESKHQCIDKIDDQSLVNCCEYCYHHQIITSSASKMKAQQNDNDDLKQEIRNGRAFLFNKMVQMMPTNMVPPETNLSDFVVL